MQSITGLKNRKSHPFHISLSYSISEFTLKLINILIRNKLNYVLMIKLIIKSGIAQIAVNGCLFSLQIWLTYDKGVQSTFCDCPRGQWRCHHMAAVMIHAVTNVSCTDRECQCIKQTT